MVNDEKSSRVRTARRKAPLQETAVVDGNGHKNETTPLSQDIVKPKRKRIKGNDATYTPPVESSLKIEDIAPTLFVLPAVEKERTESSKPKQTSKPVEEAAEKPIIEATTLWDFPTQSYGKTKKGDNKFQGVTPAFIIYNLVQRYTQPGDLVVDPMAGSGTTVDVCKEEGRKVIGYDIFPRHPDVIRNDARHIPLEDSSVDMVFIDSPYGDNVNYSDDPESIGKISAETEFFYDELETVTKEIHRILKPGKVMGWLIGDQWVKKKFTPVGFKLYERLAKYFETVDVVCVTRRNQSSNTRVWLYRARKFNFFLRGFKYLFIMRKPMPEIEKKSSKVKWAKYK